MATRMPKFLVDNSRQEEPRRENYMDATSQGSSISENKGCMDDLDNEGKDELY